MELFRFTTLKYPYLTGDGARKYGGRWNSIGTPAIYCTKNRALAMLEVLVHASNDIVSPRLLFSIDVPDGINIIEITRKKMFMDWQNKFNRTQKMGNLILTANNYCILKVPSVLLPDEYNFIINPLHKDYNQIKIQKMEEINFDPRLFKTV